MKVKILLLEDAGSAACHHNYMPSPFVASLPIDMNPDWGEKVVTEKEVVWQPGAKFYFWMQWGREQRAAW